MRLFLTLNDLFGGMLKKLGIFLALCVFVLGCSSLKFAHGFLKTMVRAQAETYLDIHEKDDQALITEISNLISWHRVEMLPKYVTFFESQAKLVEGSGWNKTQIQEAVTMLRALIKDVSQGSAPYIANVLINHTSKSKVNHIQAAMNKVLSKRHKLYDKPLAYQIDTNVDRAVTNFERFFGKLKKYQVAIIREHKMQMYDPKGGWLYWQDKRQRDLVTFLRTEPSILSIENYIKVALTTPEEIVGQAYRDQADQWWDNQAALLYHLTTSLDNKQRQKLVNNLHEYALDMAELANAP